LDLIAVSVIAYVVGADSQITGTDIVIVALPLQASGTIIINNGGST
jgi:hypothetical protein